ncbi:hypothetical protein PORY_000680 [Pneumocystis oryctolagi]|uniref:Uncharacterized protein n=1 Tax=Pneumocystis oryctolagi TaxID=42067 RepID=A0ACB7CFC8_9ASCO|nr:hypothetical protein PORY_000680 [Pneumocystis oryctolagi]
MAVGEGILDANMPSFFSCPDMSGFVHEPHKIKRNVLLKKKEHKLWNKHDKGMLRHSQSVTDSLASGYASTSVRSVSLVQVAEESPKKGFFVRLMKRRESRTSDQKCDINHKNGKLFLYFKKTPGFMKKYLKDHNSYKGSFKSSSNFPIPESISLYELAGSSNYKDENFASPSEKTSSLLEDSTSSQTVLDNIDTLKNHEVRRAYFEPVQKIFDVDMKLKSNNQNFSSPISNKTAYLFSASGNKENDIIADNSRDFDKSASQFNQSVTDYSERSFVSAREISDRNSLIDVSNKDIKDSLTEFDNKNKENNDFLKHSSSEYNALVIGKSIFYGEETYVSRTKAATWLGDCMELNSNARTVYMSQFDWSGVDILTALRRLCSKLIMKAETQQMDRILEAFSKRWYECNSSSKLTPDIVHPIAYSLLLLNTDLHVADLTQGQKMTKSQFVQNTLSTIFSSSSKSKLDIPEFSGLSLDTSVLSIPTRHILSRGLFSYNRLSTKARSSFDISGKSSKEFLANKASSVALNEELDSSIYFQLEALLKKEMYVSVKNSYILQPTISDTQSNDTQDISFMYRTNSSSFYSTLLGRTPSLSCGSLSEISAQKYGIKFKIKSWENKRKNRSQICHDNYHGSVSCNVNDWNSSFGNKVSNLWDSCIFISCFQLLSSENRSVCSFNSSCYSTNMYDHQFSTIGFAGTLNNVIKKTSIFPSIDFNCNSDNDENELALSGPPWTKEGILKHKHYLENFKKAKNRSWIECFAVLEKGELKLFQFSNSKFSERRGIIGSGNWIENANNIGSFVLLQSLASALPPPGYSPTRPYVWVLTLPNGGVHFFQAGTTELLNEWVYSANYWAARFSKEPLLGGISNVEYGWGQCLEEMENYKKKVKGNKHTIPDSNNSFKTDRFNLKLPGDRASIKTWNAPQLYLLTNTAKEEEQAKNLKNYIAILEKDAQKHNAYRPLILQAFSPRHPNLAKALLNWEKKSHYLLREIVKYKTYLECLSRALALKDERLSKNNNIYSS